MITFIVANHGKYVMSYANSGPCLQTLITAWKFLAIKMFELKIFFLHISLFLPLFRDCCRLVKYFFYDVGYVTEISHCTTVSLSFTFLS